MAAETVVVQEMQKKQNTIELSQDFLNKITELSDALIHRRSEFKDLDDETIQSILRGLDDIRHGRMRGWEESPASHSA